MITFKQYLDESINDAGILKAIFVVGLPGAGKSYTVSKLRGTISPLVVNTDRAAEYLSRKRNIMVNSQTWPEFKDDAHRITQSQLFNYVNGLLPLFVDGTSNDVSNILHRMGVLESIGYDVGVVVINTDVDTAISRANARAAEIKRSVDEEFIRTVYAEHEANVAFLRSKVTFFHTVNNNTADVLSDEQMNIAFKKAQGFFTSPVSNPVGKRLIATLKESGGKYLVPLITSTDALRKKITAWYKS